jgi:hypothetical protein
MKTNESYFFHSQIPTGLCLTGSMRLSVFSKLAAKVVNIGAVSTILANYESQTTKICWKHLSVSPVANRIIRRPAR